MAILDRLLRRGQTKQPRFDYGAMGGWQVPANWNQQAYLKNFGQIGWLFSAVSRIAQSVAEVDWHLYRQQNGQGQKEIEKHPVIDLLSYVNPFQTGQELMELSQMYLDLVGECFWVLNPTKGGWPGEIWVPPPNRMKIVPDMKEFIKGFVYDWQGSLVPFEPREVIFFKLPDPNNPYRGIGPTQAIGMDLASEHYAAQYIRNFFYNDATPGGVLAFDGTLTDDQFDRIKGQWGQQHRGVANAHKIAIVEQGAKYQQISLTQRDMDFWRLRKLERDTILGAFGLPLSVMGITENVNRANAEAGEYTFAMRVMKPRLNRFREKMNEQLLPLFSGTEQLFLDYDDPVPENRELLIGEAERGVKASFLTINEARQLLGYDTVKNGDVFIMQMTSMPTPAKELGNMRPPEKPSELEQPSLEGAVRMLLAKGMFQTEDQKEAFWKAYVSNAMAQEKEFVKVLQELFGDQEAEVLRLLQSAKKPEDALFGRKEAEETFSKALKPLIHGVLASAIEDAEVLIRPEPAHRAIKQDEPLSGDALVWLMDRAGLLVEGIHETTLNSLRIQLVDGFAEGESMPKLASRVRSIFKDCSERRSLVIARTEVIAASNEGALEGYKASGLVDKAEFYPADACEVCMVLVGEYPLDEAHGMIPVHPNCRCCWLPVI